LDRSKVDSAVFLSNRAELTKRDWASLVSRKKGRTKRRGGKLWGDAKV